MSHSERPGSQFSWYSFQVVQLLFVLGSVGEGMRRGSEASGMGWELESCGGGGVSWGGGVGGIYISWVREGLERRGGMCTY